MRLRRGRGPCLPSALSHARVPLLLALALLRCACNASTDLEASSATKPRGFLAALQAEQRAAGPAPPAPHSPVAEASLRLLQACAASGGSSSSTARAWRLAVTAVLAAFACGVAVGIALERRRAARQMGQPQAAAPAGPEPLLETPKGPALPPEAPRPAASAAASALSAASGAAAAESAAAAAEEEDAGDAQSLQSLSAGLAPLQQQQEEATREESGGATLVPVAVTLTAAPGLPPGGGGVVPPAAAAAAGAALAALSADEREDYGLAAREVHALCAGLAIDYSRLSEDGKVQLALAMAAVLRNRQDRRHAESALRLGAEANELRGQHAAAAERHVGLDSARAAHALAMQRTAALRATCSDTLTFGLAVMLAAGAHHALAHGTLAGLAPRCGGAPAPRWGAFWPVLVAQWAGCWAVAVADALLGLAVLFLTPWLVYRSGLLAGDPHATPLTRLLLGLGGACGAAGYLAVSRFGGNAAVWLAAWEAWVALHIAFSAAAHRLVRTGIRAAQAGGDVGSMYSGGHGGLTGAMWLLLGLALPLLAGTLPFRVGT